MRNKVHRALPCVAAVLCLTGCGGSQNAQEPPCDPATMNAVGGVEGSLIAADASSPSDVWAVGESSVSDPSASALAVRWDGERWSQVKVAGVESLDDVAVVGPDDAWAIGSRRAGGDIDDWLGHWDGTRWLEVSPPDWGDVVRGAIEAVAADDVWLVGTDFGTSGVLAAPYTAHWDGKRWSRSDSGVRSGLLTDISVFSADSVWAGGYASLNEYDEATGTVVLRWDGDQWLKIATPEEIDGLTIITATDHDEAWVVPDSLEGEASPLWRWDGRTWMQEVSPVNVISAMSAFDGDLWAAGSSTNVAIARLGDHEWEEASMAGVPSLDADDPFSGLVAVSKTTAWGVSRDSVAIRACVESS